MDCEECSSKLIVQTPTAIPWDTHTRLKVVLSTTISEHLPEFEGSLSTFDPRAVDVRHPEERGSRWIT